MMAPSTNGTATHRRGRARRQHQTLLRVAVRDPPRYCRPARLLDSTHDLKRSPLPRTRADLQIVRRRPTSSVDYDPSEARPHRLSRSRNASAARRRHLLRLRGSTSRSRRASPEQSTRRQARPARELLDASAASPRAGADTRRATSSATRSRVQTDEVRSMMRCRLTPRHRRNARHDRRTSFAASALGGRLRPTPGPTDRRRVLPTRHREVRPTVPQALRRSCPMPADAHHHPHRPRRERATQL